jgi:hypothetical protein
MKRTLLLSACLLACGTAMAQSPPYTDPKPPLGTVSPASTLPSDARTLSDQKGDPDQTPGSASMPSRTGMGAAPARPDARLGSPELPVRGMPPPITAPALGAPGPG